ncbi:hypothetical protein CICLE_v10023935mg [Citrus x clementina]|uniref:Uncharacterized protein n=2 Tax=Citrus TaxID=2706 RepID=V4TZF1_CITCL|nr:hypothetical protein CICLE_v10023935mg [Citrus x clementina]GAY33038.1 hypothetical protein CUMW_274530 [Citrus unshiu]
MAMFLLNETGEVGKESVIVLGFLLLKGFCCSQLNEEAILPSLKKLMIKKKLGKKMRQNWPIPHWIRMRTDNTIR